MTEAASPYVDRLTPAERAVWESKHPDHRAQLLRRMPPEYDPIFARQFASWVKPRTIAPSPFDRSAIEAEALPARPPERPAASDLVEDLVRRVVAAVVRAVRAELRPRHGHRPTMRKTGRRVLSPKTPGGRPRSILP